MILKTGIAKEKDSGFSLIEVSIALILAGLIFGFCATAWLTTLDTRKLSSGYAKLFQVKQNIRNRIDIDETYPSIDCGSTTTPDENGCGLSACQGGLRDPWGGPIRILQGLAPNGSPLAGLQALDNPGRSQNGVRPGTSSTAIDAHGRTVTEVAYVIISYGPDGLPDNTSYGQTLNTQTIATLNPAAPPDFSHGHDDQAIILTWGEISADGRNP